MKREEIEQMFKNAEPIIVSDEAYIQIEKMISEPGEPTDAMKELMKNYGKWVGDEQKEEE